MKNLHKKVDSTKKRGLSDKNKPRVISQEAETENLYKAFLGEKNQEYYLKRFKEFDRQGPGLKVSWNWAAFLLSSGWALYRRMYVWFFVGLGLSLISVIFAGTGHYIIDAIISWVFWILFTIFANSLYHSKVKKKIAAAQISTTDKTSVFESLGKNGGVHTAVIWVGISLSIIGILAAIIIPQISNYKTAEQRAGVESSNAQTSGTSSTVGQSEWEKRAETLAELKDWKGLADLCRKWAESNPNDCVAWSYIGFAYGKLQRYDDAIDAYRQAIRVNPDYAYAWHNLGLAYDDLKRYDNAIDAYRQAIRINPDYAYAWHNLALAYELSGNRTAALNAIQKLRRLDPELADKLFNIIVPR
jgi:tetratricopeptide (TPR) repeat protein